MLAAIPLRKRKLLERGVDVIDLGAGDADLSPPDVAVEELGRASRVPELQRYGFGLGYFPFREAIASFMNRRFDLEFDPVTEVIPLIGSKEGIVHLSLAFLQRGDVAILPEPGYLAYIGGSVLSEAEPYRYSLRPRTNFLLELEEIPADVLERARIAYLNYPNNPTSAIAPRDYLERTVQLCREHEILLVYDNAYSELAFDGYRPPSIFEIEGARDIAIEFHSLSKTYNMTGWRTGWAVGSSDVIGPLARVKSFMDTGSYMGIQAAATAALNDYENFVPGNVEIFKARRDAAVESFREAGFDVQVPQATMYLWIPLPEGVSCGDFAERLLEDEGVVVMPGSGFGEGGKGFFRISFITSPERIREAAIRAGRVLAGMAATAG